MGCILSAVSDTIVSDTPEPNEHTADVAFSGAPVIIVPGEFPLAGVISVSPITKPLLKPEPYRHSTTMTVGDLNERRNTFWKSRTGGSTQMWLAIQAAAEALIADDLALARAILKASDLGTSNGSLELCYDEQCRPYRTPMFCIMDPLNILRPKAPQKAIEVNAFSRSSSQSTFCIQPINLKIRINPGKYNLNIAASTSDSILDVKHFIMEKISQQQHTTTAIPICEELRQRIILMGQELQNAQLLGDVGADESKIMQVFMRPLPIIEVQNQ